MSHPNRYCNTDFVTNASLTDTARRGGVGEVNKRHVFSLCLHNFRPIAVANQVITREVSFVSFSKYNFGARRYKVVNVVVFIPSQRQLNTKNTI